MTTRRQEVLAERVQALRANADQLLSRVLLVQWVLAVVFTLLVSPRSWQGSVAHVHPHLWMAVFGGAILNALPLALIQLRPGWWGTRHAIAVAQMLWSALLIHLSGGRIETHFHVFGSLAFLAFYRDWTLLCTATAVVAVDHLARGLWWPESVYGIANPEWWRFLEHAGWVLFEDVVLFLGCRREMAQLAEVADREVSLEESRANTERQVVERTAELARSVDRYRSLVEKTKAVPLEYDLITRTLTYVAPQAAKMFGCTPETLYSAGGLRQFYHADDRRRLEALVSSIDASAPYEGATLDVRATTVSGTPLYLHIIISPRDAGAPLHSLLIDVTEQRKLETELQQAQKLESVGRLASGVAHEINTPVQFVNDSVHFAREAVDSYASVLTALRKVEQAALADAPGKAAAEAARAVAEEVNLDYLETRLPRALDRALDGLTRIATIVHSMKEFAHPDGVDAVYVDLNRAIESTLVIARNEYKYVADVSYDLDEIPLVLCHAGDVNQAVLNIVVNAAHAIGDRVRGTGVRGTIGISTRREGNDVVIAIADDGGGIPEAIQNMIFVPFFTTKEVGRGTGQGLALSRKVIVEKHGGELSFKSVPGKGTTFFIRLPIAGKGPPKQGVGETIEGRAA